jgi:hypothetical protein
MAYTQLKKAIFDNQLNEDLVMAVGAEIYKPEAWKYKKYYSNLTLEESYGVYLYVNKYRIIEKKYTFKDLMRSTKQYRYLKAKEKKLSRTY